MQPLEQTTLQLQQLKLDEPDEPDDTLSNPRFIGKAEEVQMAKKTEKLVKSLGLFTNVLVANYNQFCNFFALKAVPFSSQLDLLKESIQTAPSHSSNQSPLHLQHMLNFLLLEKRAQRLQQQFLELAEKEQHLLNWARKIGFCIDRHAHVTHPIAIPLDESNLGIANSAFIFKFCRYQLSSKGKHLLIVRPDLTKEEWSYLQSFRPHLNPTLQKVADFCLCIHHYKAIGVPLFHLRLKRRYLLKRFVEWTSLYPDPALQALFKKTVPGLSLCLFLMTIYDMKLIQQHQDKTIDYSYNMDPLHLAQEKEIAKLWGQQRSKQKILYQTLFTALEEKIHAATTKEGKKALFIFRQKIHPLFHKVEKLPFPPSLALSAAPKKEDYFQPKKSPPLPKKRSRPRSPIRHTSPPALPLSPSIAVPISLPSSESWQNLPLPFIYAERVERWFDLSPGQLPQGPLFPDYREQPLKPGYQEKNRLRHAFLPLVDKIVHLPSHTYRKDQAIHAIAQFDFADGSTEQGVIAWAHFNQRCYHRFFSNKPNLINQALLSNTQELFHQRNFPSLEEAKKMAYAPSLKKCPLTPVQRNPLFDTLEFYDASNRLTITIFPIPSTLCS